MFTRRSAAKILPRDQDARAGITRIIQRKGGVKCAVRIPSPIIEEKLAKAGFLDALKKLLGDDLIGINVCAIERRDRAGMFAEGLHEVLPEG